MLERCATGDSALTCGFNGTLGGEVFGVDLVDELAELLDHVLGELGRAHDALVSGSITTQPRSPATNEMFEMS